jgi:hypothetical protein
VTALSVVHVIGHTYTLLDTSLAFSPPTVFCGSDRRGDADPLMLVQEDWHWNGNSACLRTLSRHVNGITQTMNLHRNDNAASAVWQGV